MRHSPTGEFLLYLSHFLSSKEGGDCYDRPMDSRIEAYSVNTPDGRVVKSSLMRKFFIDLRESLREQIFDGSDLYYQPIDDGTCEVRLPSVEALENYTQVIVTETHFLLTLYLPGTILASGESRIVEEKIEYTPPALERK